MVEFLEFLGGWGFWIIVAIALIGVVIYKKLRNR